jgi:hypothetical protein
MLLCMYESAAGFLCVHKGQIVRPNKPANAKYQNCKDDMSYTIVFDTLCFMFSEETREVDAC